jgi:hypothetical protein
MTRVWLVLPIGLALSRLGTLTATDAISLRQVFHNISVLGPLVFATRNAMGTPLAHTLEPLCALLGLTVMLIGAGVRLPTRPSVLVKRIPAATN